MAVADKNKQRKFIQTGLRPFLVVDPDIGGSGSQETESQRNFNTDEPHQVQVPISDHRETESNLNPAEFNLNEILCDPALRKQINEYAPEIQEQVRRAYILKEPGRPEHFGYDVFTKTGWRDWKHAYKSLLDHVGGLGSAHNNCVMKCDDFKNQRQSVSQAFHTASQRSEELYPIRLTSTLRSSRYLLKQGLALRGHKESAISYKGNILELIEFLKDNNAEVRDAYERGGLNCKMTSNKVQKDIARSCAEEITEKIMVDIGDRNFSVLIDESRDVSVKEQMAVIIRYVNSQGNVVERFLALVHVTDTTSDALKKALFGVLDRHKLSISRIRGQGYDRLQT